jgi:sigma-B regulation protein RsbU (phosphoserine phosphatase)
MFKDWGITFKLVLLILLSAGTIFASIFAYNYHVSKRIIVKNIRQNAENLTMSTVNRIDLVLRTVEEMPESLAFALEKTSFSEKELLSLLGILVEKNPDVYGSTVAFEPYAFNGNRPCFAPYFFKPEGKLQFRLLDCESYKYFTQDWYKVPKVQERPFWSQPYYDKGGGNIVMATYSIPFFEEGRETGKFRGVVTADISLSWLQELVSSIRMGQTGYAFLLTGNGTFLTHPDRHIILNETIFAWAKGNVALEKIGEEMISGKSGFVPVKGVLAGQECWIAYAPLSTTRWSLGVIFPQDEVMADVIQLHHLVWFLGSMGILFVLIVIALITRSIIRPLRALVASTEGLAEGNLDVNLPAIKGRDEVGMLTVSFQNMVVSLKKYIADLTRTTAEKEKIESELGVAREIQMDMLKHVFPPFPDIPEFDIYAVIKPARAVGGDLYDFFPMDDDHFCFTIGDVSGKGVPASLMMAVAQTLIQTHGTEGLDPGRILEQVNRHLSKDNPSCMFVTLFMGVLDIRTGDLTYCSCGHNPPVLMSLDGKLRLLDLTEGIPLGLEEDFSFEAKTILLKKGDTLFLYTDGVTEAMNGQRQFFTEERLEQTLRDLENVPIYEMASGVMDKVEAFTGTSPQADDITVLVLRFNG